MVRDWMNPYPRGFAPPAATPPLLPPRASDTELAALEGMVKLLTGLDPQAARRVLSYGYNRFTKKPEDAV